MINAKIVNRNFSNIDGLRSVKKNGIREENKKGGQLFN